MLVECARVTTGDEWQSTAETFDESNNVSG